MNERATKPNGNLYLSRPAFVNGATQKRRHGNARRLGLRTAHVAQEENKAYLLLRLLLLLQEGSFTHLRRQDAARAREVGDVVRLVQIVHPNAFMSVGGV